MLRISATPTEGSPVTAAVPLSHGALQYFPDALTAVVFAVFALAGGVTIDPAATNEAGASVIRITTPAGSADITADAADQGAFETLKVLFAKKFTA